MPGAQLLIQERTRREIASYLLMVTIRELPARAKECWKLQCTFHQACRPMCVRAPLRKAARWKAPGSCCGTSAKTRIDLATLGLPWLLRHSDMLGHVMATMPRQQRDPSLDQKSAYRRNQ